MERRFGRYTAAIATTIAVLAATGCSLFVSLDGIDDGAMTSDASLGHVSADAVSAADASTDAPALPPCALAARVRFANALMDNGTSDTMTVTLPGAGQANDFIIVGSNYFDCNAITAVTDTAGNTYESLVSAAGNDNAGVLETWGATNVGASGADVITVHYAVGCDGRNVKAVEYSGVDVFSPIANTATMFGTGGAPDAAITTSSAAILFAHTADSRMSNGPGSGWTQIVNDGWATIAEERFVTSGGSFAATEQSSSTDDWGIEAVALRVCKSP